MNEYDLLDVAMSYIANGYDAYQSASMVADTYELSEEMEMILAECLMEEAYPTVH